MGIKQALLNLVRCLAFLLLSATIFTNAAFASTVPHTEFTQSILSNANDINNQILSDRKKLKDIEQSYNKTQELSYSQKNWLTQLASAYKVAPNFSQAKTWKELEEKVDVIPPSLVVAQSAQESGWGSSYLAKDAHNYFGQECGSSRTCYHKTDYRYFRSMHEAIAAYMSNLNSNHAYQKLRETRYAERQQKQAPNSLAMAEGLHSYSILHERYIHSLQNLIHKYNLQQYDKNLG